MIYLLILYCIAFCEPKVNFVRFSEGVIERRVVFDAENALVHYIEREVTMKPHRLVRALIGDVDSQNLMVLRPMRHRFSNLDHRASLGSIANRLPLPNGEISGPVSFSQSIFGEHPEMLFDADISDPNVVLYHPSCWGKFCGVTSFRKIPVHRISADANVKSRNGAGVADFYRYRCTKASIIFSQIYTLSALLDEPSTAQLSDVSDFWRLNNQPRTLPASHQGVRFVSSFGGLNGGVNPSLGGSESSVDQPNGEGAKDETKDPGSRHPEREDRHLLLRLQILFGACVFAGGLYLKANAIYKIRTMEAKTFAFDTGFGIALVIAGGLLASYSSLALLISSGP